MFQWLYQNLLDEQREAIVQTVRDNLEHSDRCPVRYRQKPCICHVERAVQIIEGWQP